MTVKTRFAPSPTGYLHVGGARTALFSWLHAKQHQGTFILRIEDTDLERSTEASVQAIFDGMNWLGLSHDEGPYFQTKRFDHYKTVIQNLFDNDHAYHCYCSKEELETMRETQMANKEKPRYDGRCRNRTEPREGVQPVIRFKNPTEGQVEVNDLVRGKVTFKNSELDDLIIARSDGSPTYNLTVVVDDNEMGVTCVIRGDDHLNNTPRQINILKALGKEQPSYAHVPMILGSDGKRLSKRHGAVGVMQYRDDGYLPDALLNYLVRLGWSYGDQEVFSREEMIKLFDVEKVNKAASTFNPEKLLWLNQHYIKESPAEYIAEHLQWHLQQQEIDTSNGPDLLLVIDALRERAKTLVELAQSMRYFYHDFESFDEKAAKKNLKPAILPAMQELKQALNDLDSWETEAIHQCVIDTAERLELKLGKIAQPFRVAITGAAVSPSIDITAKLIGKERVLARMQQAISQILVNV